MPVEDMVVSVYRHGHHHRTVRKVVFQYQETGTSVLWTISTAMDLVYFVRMGPGLATERNEDQIFDASLMCRRMECALLLAFGEIYRFELVGGVVISHLEVGNEAAFAFAHGRAKRDNKKAIPDWFGAFSQHTWLRRAAEDLYLALTIEREDLLFLYRAYEWLKLGLGANWKDLGGLLDVPQQNINWLKQAANDHQRAARHAAESGVKVRIGKEHIDGWVAGTRRAIMHARARVDLAFAQSAKARGDLRPD